MKLRFKQFCLAALATLALGAISSQSVYATPILMLDFGGTTVAAPHLTNSPYHTLNPSFADTFWIKRSANGTGGLFYSDGTTVAPLVLDLGMTAINGTVISLASNPDGNNGLGSQTNTGIYDGTSPARDAIYHTATEKRAVGLQIRGLDPGIYDLYLAARNTNASVATEYTVYAGAGANSANFDFTTYASGTLAYASAADHTASWIEDANYIKLTVSLASGQALNIASASTDGDDLRGFLNLVQIVQVPEPTSFALLLVGMIGFGRLRRRTTVS